MKIHNQLPLLLECLKRWESLPSEARFLEEYAKPMSGTVGDFFEDYYSVLQELEWKEYRDQALKLDPAKEELRVRRTLDAVEALFGFKLQGDFVLQGSFAGWDGYARFDHGTHKVFLGADESHANGRYLDILIAHELTHVARESRPSVWEGFGLDPKMSNDDFTKLQPVIEHLMGEGFSCAVSELLVPNEPKWMYTYQTRESMNQVIGNAREIDHAIKSELKSKHGHYHNLYALKPIFSHYVWAWLWAKALLAERAGGDPRKLVGECSKDFVGHALGFDFGVGSKGF